MSRRYAQDTTVPIERTQAEIGKLLSDHGATARAVGADDSIGRAVIMFALGGRRIRVDVPLPTEAVVKSRGNPRGWWSWSDAERDGWVRKQLAQKQRVVWRGLRLVLQAKLEAVENGYTTIEREFLPDVLLPGGATVYQLVEPTIETAYRTGQVPPLLAG